MAPEPRYNLYYVPEFPIEKFDRFHREPEKELKRFVDTLTEHIRQFGLRNPPCAQRRKGIIEVRPGKCRVSAYRTLGHDTIPVFLVDYDKGPAEPGWEPLPYDRDEIQSRLFTGDCVVEMERRFCNVKKNVDAVHRPGVENAFAKELREKDARSREMLGQNDGGPKQVKL